MKGFKAFFEKLDVKSHGYIVNKYLTNGAFVLLLLYLAFIVHVDGWDILAGGVYVECPADADMNCLNPYYDSSCEITGAVCEPVYLLAGESIGEKPSFYARTFALVAILVVAGALFLNHYLYNKNWKVKKLEKEL